jgi:hypothetical protein
MVATALHLGRFPSKALERFFIGEVFEKLAWYTTSFFPLFCAALAKPLPQPRPIAAPR